MGLDLKIFQLTLPTEERRVMRNREVTNIRQIIMIKLYFFLTRRNVQINIRRLDIKAIKYEHTTSYL